MTTPARLNQVALSVVDLRRADSWFRTGFGLLPAGGTRSFRGPLASHVQGLPRAASTCWWLVGRDEYLQLELFQFESPLAKPLPADHRPCDIGYSRIGIWVQDFDATLARLTALQSPPLTEPMGPRGQRRACVRSPDGVFVEVMEDDPLAGRDDRAGPARPECPAALRYVTLSVPNLGQSLRLFSGALQLARGRTLHGPEHEALWNLAGADCEVVVLDAGDVLVELAQYIDPPGRPRPPGHRICDQGLLNIAFGYRTMRAMLADYRRCRDAGARPNGFPLHSPAWGVVYVNDLQGFSVELLWVRRWWDRRMGFLPQAPERRPAPERPALPRG